MMKAIGRLFPGLVLIFLLAATVAAQEKTKPSEEAKQATPLKLQIVFSEYDGEKKVSSMPYSLSADDREQSNVRLRMGIKIPLVFPINGVPSVQYLDVGTGIDCRVKRLDDGRFSLSLNVRRTSVQLPEGFSSGKDAAFVAGEQSGRPVLRDFSVELVVFLRDGESRQSTVGTDPLSGHQVKVDVTLNVVK